MTGTIDGFTTPDTTVTGLSITLGDFMLAMRDGDFDAINQAVWGRADTITTGASDDLIRGFGGSDTRRRRQRPAAGRHRQRQALRRARKRSAFRRRR
ncbi:hypothetical protein [Novosphingobium sp. KCTC 2891]|uniref:hypothetical protein n=1 Tax=Novosphingobium sp. KCTC 2891 TaxID=2989730 RepID=UPI0029CA36FA|nr:hypothetical protein [Novosphingobium sp. KCTC 2891]